MYKKKLLFRNSNASYDHDASALESIWAYLSAAEKSKSTGRFRIRITKMSGQELAAMGLAPEGTPSDFFGLQASLDRWHADSGWLPLFDWVGNPDDTIDKIEKDLAKQFQSFVSGVPVEEDFSFDLPSPVKPPASKARPMKVPDSQPEQASPKEPDPDFDWI